MLQRSEARSRYNISGNACEDCCSAYCCPLCDLMQTEKETQYRESVQGQPITQQYQPQDGMACPAPAYSPPPKDF